MLMDGGSNNRKFLKLHGNTEITKNPYIIRNPLKPDHEVTAMMDPCVSDETKPATVNITKSNFCI